MQKEWKDIYQKCKWGNQYPNEGLIRFIAWHYTEETAMGKKALDSGCGNGINSLLLADKGFEVYGYDGSKDAIMAAKARLSDHGYRTAAERMTACEFQKLEYEDDFFDLIIDIAFLSCLNETEIRELLQIYRKKLKAGGMFYCTGLHEVDGAYGLDTALCRNGDQVGRISEGRLKGEYTHSFFTAEKIDRIFREAGFSDLQINYFREEYEEKRLRYSYFSVFVKNVGGVEGNEQNMFCYRNQSRIWLIKTGHGRVQKRSRYSDSDYCDRQSFIAGVWT